MVYWRNIKRIWKLCFVRHAYEKIIEKNKNYFEIENILKSEDFNDNVKVMGSFNPAFTCLDSEFYDDYHAKRSRLKKILIRIY